MKIDKKIIVVSEIIYKEGFEVIYEKKNILLKYKNDAMVN
jgi:hypothetical protein